VRQLQQSIRDFGRVAEQIAAFTEQQTTVLRGVGERLGQGSDVLVDAASSLQSSLARVDSATNQGELDRILDNTAAASQQMRQASEAFGELMAAARANQQSVVHVLQAADTIMTRIQNRQGTVGLLVGDSTLYRETTLAIQQLRSLLADIQANPRKYFKFSVF
jgi:phospholipid/cholesterol/gamma-HCH transport system substrate-binding protein